VVFYGRRVQINVLPSQPERVANSSTLQEKKHK
jgi:hypothetical protein